MLSIQKHSFFWALLTRRPCAALALAANLKSSAKRIIEIATKGERGPERLCNGALKGIQKSVPGSEKPYWRFRLDQRARAQKDLDGPK